MATGATAGRDRYRWLLLLVAAAMLVAWLVTGGGQEPEPGATTATEPSSFSSSATPSPGTDPESGLPYVDGTDDHYDSFSRIQRST